MNFYRFSTNRKEIINNMEQKLSSSKALSVWQKNDLGERIILEEMHFLCMYGDEGVFTLNIKRSEIKKLNPTKDIYFLLDEHDFIFKTKLAIDQKEHVTFQIPKEVRLTEKRTFERTYYNLEDKKYVEVVFTSKDESKIFTLTCPLVNISKGGACIVISKETISSINLKFDLKVKYAKDIKEAAVRNARVFMKKNLEHDEFYALGIEFHECLQSL